MRKENWVPFRNLARYRRDHVAKGIVTKWINEMKVWSPQLSPKNVFGASTGFEHMASVLALQCATNWAMKTHTLGAGQFVELIVPVKGMFHSFVSVKLGEMFEVKLDEDTQWEMSSKNTRFDCCRVIYYIIKIKFDFSTAFFDSQIAHLSLQEVSARMLSCIVLA